MIFRERIRAEGNRVSEDFSLRHGSLEHKENKRASRYILCRRPQEAQVCVTRPQRFLKKLGSTCAALKKEPRAVYAPGACYTGSCLTCRSSVRAAGVSGDGSPPEWAYLETI